HPCREAVFSHVNSSIVDLGVIGVVDNKMRIRMLFGRPFWPLGPATGGKDQHTRADQPFHSSDAFMQETTCSGFSSSAFSIVRFRSKVPATLRRSDQIAMLPARTRQARSLAALKQRPRSRKVLVVMETEPAVVHR